MEVKMWATGGSNFCCPNCKKNLKVKYTIHGDDEEEDCFSPGTVTVDDVQERLWFDEIVLDNKIENKGAKNE